MTKVPHPTNHRNLNFINFNKNFRIKFKNKIFYNASIKLLNQYN